MRCVIGYPFLCCESGADSARNLVINSANGRFGKRLWSGSHNGSGAAARVIHRAIYELWAENGKKISRGRGMRSASPPRE
ncbi:hypothetical protein [Methylovirgula sp. HY1]|uniref:hypothetical protein n=1 Tax=Methylovirgula sp. HY1 TaxID=2822761 RepID=UPI001C5BC610|nr:hypothetical protein [Methylovirgula sp. HY1]